MRPREEGFSIPFNKPNGKGGLLFLVLLAREKRKKGELLDQRKPGSRERKRRRPRGSPGAVWQRGKGPRRGPPHQKKERLAAEARQGEARTKMAEAKITRPSRRKERKRKIRRCRRRRKREREPKSFCARHRRLRKKKKGRCDTVV